MISSTFVEGLLYALTAFGVLAFGCVEPWSRAALEVLSFLLALACFLRGREAPSRAAGLFWLLPAAAAALGFAQLASPLAADWPRPLAPFTADAHETQEAVLLWLAYAAVVWSVPRAISSHEAARRYTRFLVGLGMAVAALGLAQAATGGDLYWVRRVAPGAHPFGPYYNKDHAANLLLMCAAVGAGSFFARIRPVSEMDGYLPEQLRSLGGRAACAALIVAGFLFCGSRGALLAVPLAGAGLALAAAGSVERARSRRVRAAAALAAGALVVFLAFRHVSAGADAGGVMERSVAGRLSIYWDAARWLRDSPLFGSGLGTFETVYPSYQDQGLSAKVDHAHSDWLELALEAGLPGAALALAAAALLAFVSTRAWRKARSREMRALIAGAAAAAAAFAAHALFEFAFRIPGNAVLFLGLVGFLLSAPAWMHKSAERAPAATPPPGESLLAAGAFLLLALSATRPAVAAWQGGEPGSPAERVGSLARALSNDDSPRLMTGLAAASYALAAGGEELDIPLLRAAMGYSLAGLAKRPFDADALFLSGRILWRLGRHADAAEMFDRSRTVRFALIRPAKNARVGRR